MRAMMLALMLVACRVEPGWDVDADLEVDADVDADGPRPCQFACDGIDCSGRGVCDMDLSDCTPYCLCWAGYHESGGDGLACIPD